MEYNVDQWDMDEYSVAYVDSLEDRVERLESMVKHLEYFEYFVWDILPTMDEETQAIYKEVTGKERD